MELIQEGLMEIKQSQKILIHLSSYTLIFINLVITKLYQDLDKEILLQQSQLF